MKCIGRAQDQMTIYMHKSTWKYLMRRDITHIRDDRPIYSDMFGGEKVVLDNNLEPTIDETFGWIFPKEPFIKYEPKDEEMCRYFGWGRQGRGYIVGQIVQMDDTIYNFSTIFNPKMGMRVEVI